jgi:hypothetical protein
LRNPRLAGWQRLPEIARLPQLASLHTLRLDCLRLTDAVLPPLLQSPHLRGLRLLDLRWNDLTDDSIPALLASPLADTLEELRLGGNHFQYARRLRARYGERFDTDNTRDGDHLYTIQPSYHWVTGLTADGRQVLIVPGEERRPLAICFDLDGNSLDTEVDPAPPSDARYLGRLDDDARVQSFVARLGLQPGPIRVKGFFNEDTEIYIGDFSGHMWDVADHPPERPDGTNHYNERYNRLKTNWIRRGCYVFWYGNDNWMSGDGYVEST